MSTFEDEKHIGVTTKHRNGSEESYAGQNGFESEPKQHELKRSLKNRHIAMIRCVRRRRLSPPCTHILAWT